MVSELRISMCALVISVAQFVCSTPMLWNFYVTPSVSLKMSSENAELVSYELTNSGWAAATNVRLEIDAFSEIESIASRPDLGMQVRKTPSGNYLVSYPRLDEGETATINISVSGHTDLSKEFGAAGIYYARYDDGPVDIIYPNSK